MSKNINTNTNIAQIILSDKHEIRLKKKPKKKSSNKKKEALEKVKSALQQYDVAINTAKSKNIPIPEALGKLPDNINQINSISELNALALDLQNRILQINELIQKGSSRATGLFREIAGPQQRGFIPIQQQIQPQIIPNQQIPKQPIQPIQPQQPVSPQKQEDDDAEKTLDELQKEILSKLDPEDRAKAEAQFEKERQERQSQQPVQPEIPQPETDTDTDDESPVDSNFEMINGLEGIDGRTINNLKAPIGWATIYSEYRQLIKSLIADIIKIDGDEYNLPKSEDRDIQERQEQLLKEYNAWLNSLNKTQTDYLDTDMTLQTLDNSLIRDLQTPPTELLQRIAKEQGKDINVYSGTASKTEQKESRSLSPQAEEFKKQLINNQKGINSLLEKASRQTFKNDTDKQLRIYDGIISNANIFDARLEEQFNSLDGTDKAGILSLYNKTRDGLKVAIREISESKQNYLDSNEIDVLNPIDFDAPVFVKKTMPLPKPRPKLTPQEEQQKKLKEALSKMKDPFTPIEPEGAKLPQDELDKKNVAILLEYYTTPTTRFRAKQQDAYLELFGGDKLATVKNKARPQKLTNIFRELKKKYPAIPDSEFKTVASQ
jgi:hypothetical protein